MKKVLLLLLVLTLSTVTVYASDAASLDDYDTATVLVSSETSFAFSPDATGYWTFYASTISGIPYLWLTNEFGHLLGEGGIITAHLVEGAEYIVYAGFRGSDGGSYMLSLFWSETFTPPAFFDPSIPTVESLVMPAGGGRLDINGEALISFTPNTSGLWLFEVHSDADEGFPMWIDDPFGNTLAFDNFLHEIDGHASFTVRLTAGVEYTIETMMLMWIPLEYAISATLTRDFVSWLDYDHLEAEGFTLDLEAERREIPSAGGNIRVQGETWFSFTPDTTGAWTFSTRNRTGDPLLVITDNYGSFFLGDDDSAGDLNARFSVYLTAGVEYVVWARFWQPGASGNYILDVVPFEEAEDDNEVHVFPGVASALPIEAEYQFFEFTPDFTETWTIQSNDPSVMIFMGDASGSFAVEMDNWGNVPAVITLDMAEGVEYNIITWLPNWVAPYGARRVLSISTSYQIHALENGTAHRHVVREQYFNFIPEATGYWIIYTSHNYNSDPHLQLLDSSRNLLLEDDDGGTGLNAQIKAHLVAGRLYHIRAGFFEGAGEYFLNVRRATTYTPARPRLMPPARAGENAL